MRFEHLESETSNDEVVKLSDGRVMGIHAVGRDHGYPIIHLHGRGVSRLEVTLVESDARAKDVRLIGIDRPGIGLSTAKPGFKITDLPGDVVEIADQLGIERFAVEGLSAGGAYALACAHQIPDRLTGCILISTTVHSDYLMQGVSPERRTRLKAAQDSPSEFRAAVLQALPDGPDEISIQNAVDEFLSGSPSDERVFRDSEMRASLAHALAEGLRQGPAAIADETIALIQPWGFSLADVDFDRVFMRHGELDNRVPAGAARMLAEALPNCDAMFYPDGGHLSTFVEHVGEAWDAVKG